MNSNITVIRGTNDKPVASEKLADFFEENTKYNGEFIVGFPIIGTSEGSQPIDALWVSPNNGVVIFDLIEGKDPGNFIDRQDDAANKLEAKFKTHRELVIKRDLLVPIHTVSFAPAINSIEEHTEEDYFICNTTNLEACLDKLEWNPQPDTHLYNATLSAIQNISTIRKTRKRNTKREDSRGGKLKKLEDSIATLDKEQGEAVIETVEGVQRIRGLAGSGKTIVLALKAAYLHAQHPDWRIAVTFNTRSLKGQFRKLINTFCIEQTGEEPDWENLFILNAWGAPGGREREGIYHEFCKANDVPYYDFQAARQNFGQGKEFESVCEEALKLVKEAKNLYDVILVDEAQDFSSAFLRLCFNSLDENKRLVYAYDELQNLFGESMPSPEDIFGYKPDGTPVVSLKEPYPEKKKKDIILKKCYRNSRPVLATAHALGFGIYRKKTKVNTGLVQMFDHPQLWEDIGYEVKNGELKEGSNVTLFRPEYSSPRFLENHSNIDDIVKFKKFESVEEQNDWLIENIKHDLNEEELRYDDIVVINPNPITTRQKLGPIRSKMLKEGINSHLAGIDTNPDIFFNTDIDSITFTSIFRAKGNEAGMIYIVNAHDCHSSFRNLASIRNRLFTAITRSKAWVRVLGIGEGMDKLIEEFENLKRMEFELSFTYPTEDERRNLQIVHRDMTIEDKKRIESQEKGLNQLIEDIEAGRVLLEDLDDNIIKKLSALLNKME